jgi:glutamate N-acetyltransferase/amino-acid N-acetyltransferase
MRLKDLRGGVLAPKGFLGAGVTCGLKPSGVPDLAVVFSERPAAAAAVFTENRLCAAPVKLSRAHVRRGRLRAIVVNSGSANACTGERGLEDARAMAEAVGRALNIPPTEVAVASTGVIGHRLDMRKIRRGIRKAVSNLSRGPKAARDVARAIMTTDTVPKSVAVSYGSDGRDVCIGGIAKGAGMIAPRLGHATLLVFLATDAAVEPSFLRRCLSEATRQTFNLITIDADTSTNDSVFLLANGAAGGPGITRRSRGASRFREALTHVCDELARRIVADGEGATKFIEIRVTGAASDQDAEKAARAIAQSPLFKTAMYGKDPNWGRIVAATGYSGARVREDQLRIAIGGVTVVSNGAPRKVAPNRLAGTVSGRKVTVDVALGLGAGRARIYTCDLSHEYVSINAHYST